MRSTGAGLSPLPRLELQYVKPFVGASLYFLTVFHVEILNFDLGVRRVDALGPTLVALVLCGHIVRLSAAPHPVLLEASVLMNCEAIVTAATGSH